MGYYSLSGPLPKKAAERRLVDLHCHDCCLFMFDMEVWINLPPPLQPRESQHEKNSFGTMRRDRRLCCTIPPPMRFPNDKIMLNLM